MPLFSATKYEWLNGKKTCIKCSPRYVDHYFEAGHTVRFLDVISLFTNKMHYFSTNTSIRLIHEPIPVAERSKARVCGRSPAEIADSNPAGGMDVCLL